MRRANTFAGSRGEGVRGREEMRERVRRSEPVQYPSRFKEIEGERRESEAEQAQRSTSEVKGRASMGNNYVFEEDGVDDDDEFVLVEDLSANAQQPEPTQDPPRSVSESGESWESVRREARTSENAASAEMYSDSDYGDEEDDDEFVTAERENV